MLQSLGADAPEIGKLESEACAKGEARSRFRFCLLYTSDAADERSSVDLGGRRIIKKKNTSYCKCWHFIHNRDEDNKLCYHRVTMRHIERTATQ
mgnify:CR=1 FL=1